MSAGPRGGSIDAGASASTGPATPRLKLQAPPDRGGTLRRARLIDQVLRSVDDVVATWKTPAAYAGYNAPQPARVKANAEVIFGETK